MGGDQLFIRYDSNWSPQACPVCGRKSVAHGVLYEEEPVSSPLPDERRPIGDAFLHDEGPDCRRHFAGDEGGGMKSDE